MAEYNFSKVVGLSYDEALNVIPGKLKEQGFGILTEIDVRETMKKKLDIDFPRYKILGACNPPFAHKALTAEIEIGTLLPCNVIVYEKDGKTVLSVMKPSIAMSMVKNPELEQVAAEVESRLETFFNSVN